MNGNPGENAYTIIETLHKSRQFCVYKARNYFTGKIVTIKSNGQVFRSDADQVRQLRDEAETGLRLKHPNIRETIGLFEDGGTVYMVCEFLEGDPLNDILRIPQVDISYSQAIKWTLQLLDALEHAHKHLILHLNLNPSNLIITADYDLKVLGFGKSPHSWKNADPELHAFHPVLFTPPEIFYEQNPDERSDFWSVGVVSWLLLRGRLPWEIDRRESPSGQKQQTLAQGDLNPQLPGRHIPPWLFSILNKALQADPAKRFTSAAEMRDAITQQRESPIPTETAVPAPGSEKTAGTDPNDHLFAPPRQQYGPSQPSRVQGWQGQTGEKPLLADTQPGSRAAETTIVTPETRIRVKSKELSPELRKMQKTFRILGLVSALIVVYIVLKYVVIRDRPVFSRVDVPDAPAQISEPAVKVQNQALTMISVPGGTAIIGNTGPQAKKDEYPLLKVTLPSFLITPLEITREQWAMVHSDHEFTEEERNLPVTGVSFDEAVEYCNEKSRLDGLQPCYEFLGNGVICDFKANGYRLPSEAEWEYAAKARRNENYNIYSGSTVAEVVAWYFANSGGKLHPSGQKQPNQLGIRDLSGNAAEWVWNWYSPYSSILESPFAGPEFGTDKVIRGGSFQDPAENIRVTSRAHAKPYAKSDHIGFRVARTK
ncbi:MAG: bifunctional serine/threonine-protein kinase/formylglycine-generating enzyme family protein [Candidatus Cloacimonadaceae bacterium]